MKKINLMAPVNKLGYGVAGANIAHELNKICQVSLFPIGNAIDPPSQGVSSKLQVMLDRKSSFDKDATCIKIWHEFSLAERIGAGKFIAFPFFEVNKFDKVRKHHIESCDKVVASCGWAKDIILSETEQKNVSVVPLGVDTSVFSFIGEEQYPQEKCVFFNCGKWEKRKGHDILLELFKQAFPNNNDVELWMMTQNPLFDQRSNDNWNNYYKSDPRVVLVGRTETQEELAKIMRHTTCGVFPSRAEGWNLEALEMMALGKDIIITNYSAHTEFCNSDNSHLIEPIGLEPAVDGVFFNGDFDAEWMSLDGLEKQIISEMRSVYETWKKSKGILEPNYAGIETANKFSWSETAKQLLKESYEDSKNQETVDV